MQTYTKKQMEIFYTIFILLTGAGGYAVGHYIPQEKIQYDPVKDREEQVDIVMQNYIENPTEDNNGIAYSTLFFQNQWAERHGNTAFIEYLVASDNVRLAILHGENKESIKSKINTMNEKRAVFE